MSALANGCYTMMPIPDPKLGPRRVDVETMYNTETLPAELRQQDRAADLSHPGLRRETLGLAQNAVAQTPRASQHRQR